MLLLLLTDHQNTGALFRATDQTFNLAVPLPNEVAKVIPRHFLKGKSLSLDPELSRSSDFQP